MYFGIALRKLVWLSDVTEDQKNQVNTKAYYEIQEESIICQEWAPALTYKIADDLLYNYYLYKQYSKIEHYKINLHNNHLL